MRAAQSLRMIQPTQRLMMRPTRRMMKVPDEEQTAHTVSQRIRRLKQIPPELIPIGVVVGVALGFAAYSLGNKFVQDKTMRLSRQNRKD